MYQVIHQLLLLQWRLKKQEKYLKKQLPLLLARVAPGHQQVLTPAFFKRTTKYWQLGLNVICDNLYRLTGRKLNDGEYERIILLSVFGPLFDDLFDEKVLDQQQLADPEKYLNSSDELVARIYRELVRTAPDRFTKVLKDVCYWQNESLKQLDEHIGEEELYQITYNKSYYAVLLYCSVMDHYPGKELLDIIYPVSGLLQLTNDAFDVWKDVQEGVYTLPNLYRNFEQLKSQFKAEIALINNKLDRFLYPAKVKSAFAITVHALPAMGWMALQHLQQVAVRVSSMEEMKCLSRKTLVCDMDSLPQQMRWLKLINRFRNYKGLPGMGGH